MLVYERRANATSKNYKTLTPENADFTIKSDKKNEIFRTQTSIIA
jgi:hypothetical protein